MNIPTNTSKYNNGCESREMGVFNLYKHCETLRQLLRHFCIVFVYILVSCLFKFADQLTDLDCREIYIYISTLDSNNINKLTQNFHPGHEIPWKQ